MLDSKLWFGYITLLTQWGRGGYFTCSNEFYLPAATGLQEGGGGRHPVGRHDLCWFGSWKGILYRLAWQGAAHLRATFQSKSWSVISIFLNYTPICQYSSAPMPSLWANPSRQNNPSASRIETKLFFHFWESSFYIFFSHNIVFGNARQFKNSAKTFSEMIKC